MSHKVLLLDSIEGNIGAAGNKGPVLCNMSRKKCFEKQKEGTAFIYARFSSPSRQNILCMHLVLCCT